MELSTLELLRTAETFRKGLVLAVQLLPCLAGCVVGSLVWLLFEQCLREGLLRVSPRSSEACLHAGLAVDLDSFLLALSDQLLQTVAPLIDDRHGNGRLLMAGCSAALICLVRVLAVFRRNKVQQLAESVIVFNESLQNPFLISVVQCHWLHWLLVTGSDEGSLTLGPLLANEFLRSHLLDRLPEGLHEHLAHVALINQVFVVFDNLSFPHILCTNIFQFLSHLVDLGVLFGHTFPEEVFDMGRKNMRVVLAFVHRLIQIVLELFGVKRRIV